MFGGNWNEGRALGHDRCPRPHRVGLLASIQESFERLEEDVSSRRRTIISAIQGAALMMMVTMVFPDWSFLGRFIFFLLAITVMTTSALLYGD